MKLILILINYILLIFFTAVEPNRSGLSKFEIARRLKSTDQITRREGLREEFYIDITTWFRLLAGVALVAFVMSATWSYGWLIGGAVAVVGVLEYIAIARLKFVSGRVQKFYNHHEDKILNFANKHAGKFKFLRGRLPRASAQAVVASKDELLHILVNQADYLTADERKLLVNGLEFADKTVASIMTPRSVVNTVAQDDTIGPLLLDEMHKTGNSRFPVIDGDIDHVVGVLHLRDVISIDTSKVKQARDMMRVPVYYIKDDQTVRHALAAFLRVKNHLFVVVNEYRETVGIITLEDVIEAILGRRINDEFDAHDDLRAVARRNPRGNNAPKHAKTI